MSRHSSEPRGAGRDAPRHHTTPSTATAVTTAPGRATPPAPPHPSTPCPRRLPRARPASAKARRPWPGASRRRRRSPAARRRDDPPRRSPTAPGGRGLRTATVGAVVAAHGVRHARRRRARGPPPCPRGRRRGRPGRRGRRGRHRVPFGRYGYAGTLGPKVLGVPLSCPLAWTMMAYPAVAACRLARGPAAGRRGGGPGRVAAGAGRLGPLPRPADGRRRPLDLAQPTPALPGRARRPADELRRLAAGRPALTALLDRLLRARRARSRRGAAVRALPVDVARSVLANLVFFGLPASALWAGSGWGSSWRRTSSCWPGRCATADRAAGDRRPASGRRRR